MRRSPWADAQRRLIEQRFGRDGAVALDRAHSRAVNRAGVRAVTEEDIEAELVQVFGSVRA